MQSFVQRRPSRRRIIGGDGTKERLQNLAHDEIPDVRFNAATSLARLGSKEAVETLREMLSLPDEPVLDDLGQAKRYRRAMIVLNALRAMALLVDSIDEVPEGVLEQVKSWNQILWQMCEAVRLLSQKS